jgi:hypothetical protein
MSAMEVREILQTEEKCFRRRRRQIKNKRTCPRRKHRWSRTNNDWRRNLDVAWQHKNNRPGHNRVLRMATRHAAIHRRCPPTMVATCHRHILRRIGITRTLLRRMPMQRAHRPIAASHARSLQSRSPSRRPQQHHRHQTHTRPQPSSRSVGIVAHSLHFPNPKDTPPVTIRKFNLQQPAGSTVIQTSRFLSDNRVAKVVFLVFW